MNWILFFVALAIVETGDTNKINYNELAYTKYQIRPIFVEDYRRITGNRIQMIDLYSNDDLCKIVIKTNLMHYGDRYKKETGSEPDYKVYAAIYNGGPNGYKKESTVEYVKKFERVYKSLSLL